MDGQQFVVPAEIGRRQIADEIDGLHPVHGRHALAPAQVAFQVAARLLVMPVGLRRTRDQQGSGDVLHVPHGLVVVVGEMILGDVGRERVRHRDAVHHLAVHGGRAGEGADRLRVGDEARGLVADVAGLLDPVVHGDERGRADEEVEERRLVGHGREPVELHEGVRQHPGEVPLAGQEDALVRDEHVVEHGQGFDQVVFRADRMVIRALAREPEGTGDEPDARRVDGHGEGHGVILVFLGDRPRGQHDHFVHEGGSRGMGLGAPDHDAVGPPFHDAHVVVGMGLLGGQAAAVSLGVGLGDGHAQVAVAAFGVVVFDAVQVFRAVLFVDLTRDEPERKQGVRADLLDEQDHAAAVAGARLDHLPAFQQVFGVGRWKEVPADAPARLGTYRREQAPVRLVLGEPVIQCRVLGAHAQFRVFHEIRHPLAAKVDRPAVPQAFQVFCSRSQCHCLSPITIMISMCYKILSIRVIAWTADLAGTPALCCPRAVGPPSDHHPRAVRLPSTPVRPPSIRRQPAARSLSSMRPRPRPGEE